MKLRVYSPYDFLLQILIEYCVTKLFFGPAATAEAKDLDQRLRQIKTVRHMPG
jgi:hypothetical protein